MNLTFPRIMQTKGVNLSSNVIASTFLCHPYSKIVRLIALSFSVVSISYVIYSLVISFLSLMYFVLNTLFVNYWQ